MAKTKYSKKVVDIIINAIELRGLDKAGYTAANISYDTFYVWKKKHPEFTERINHAKQVFRLNNSQEDIGILAYARMKEILAEGKTITTTVETPQTITTKLNGAGDVIQTEIQEKKVTVTKRHFPPSESLLKLCLPPLHIQQAIDLLEHAGYIVLNPHEAANINETKGLSEESYNQIVGNILGVDSRESEPGDENKNPKMN